jgi:hypothetical protein
MEEPEPKEESKAEPTSTKKSKYPLEVVYCGSKCIK